MLQATALTAGAVGASSAASADDDDEHDDDGDGNVDQPEGFSAEVLQGHAPFPDEVAGTFSLTLGDADSDDSGSPIGAHVHLNDESTMVVAEVTWEPGGTSGWHRHPGVAFVSITEGEIEVTWEREGVSSTYETGDGFFDPGVPHRADNLSDDAGARAYVVFLGIPAGAPATEWIEP